MTHEPAIDSYGVLLRRSCDSLADLIVEEISTLGYSIVSDCLPDADCKYFRSRANELFYGGTNSPDANVVRAPWSFDRRFLTLARHPLIREIIGRMILGDVLLNQQNLIRNPGGDDSYSQARYHRDLPYQHFIATRPIALNVLVCLDEFTEENGSTLVIPGSHKEEQFPSPEFISRHKVKAIAPRGSMIFLHSMTYHAGGMNATSSDRLAINHVYASAMLRTQLDHAEVIETHQVNGLEPEDKKILGLQI